MLNLLADKIVFGSKYFGFGYPSGTGNPAVYVLGYPIYLYALIIVTGMTLAILLSAHFFKKRGYDPYDVCVYALAVIPLGVLGARLYVFIFPWAGQAADWGNFFNFRSGGLGIYGGVILGYLTAMMVAKIKKHDYKIVADAIVPGLLIAQSIGRWGNFVNQEAYGNVITNPAWQWFPFGVNIGGVWHQATFFYESMATLCGFVICLLLLSSKKYKLGWLTAFYGIYYGIARLLIEGLRTDSLYLWIGTKQTDIKISQLVSIFTIVLGVVTILRIYRKPLYTLYGKLFKSEYNKLATTRWLLVALSAVLVGVSVFAFLKGGESMFILGFACDVLAIYTFFASFAFVQRKKCYCTTCQKSFMPTLSNVDKITLTILTCLLIIFVSIVLLVIFALNGVKNHAPNSIVVAVIFAIVTIVAVIAAFNGKKKLKANHNQDLTLSLFKQALASQPVQISGCDQAKTVNLNKVLLFVYPYDTYLNFGIDHLTPWVDPDKDKKSKKASNQD